MDLNTEDGETQTQIAEIIGLSIGWVSEIISTFTSEHGDKSATKADKRRKLTEKDRIAISRHLLRGEGQKEAAKRFGVSQSEILGISKTDKINISIKPLYGRQMVRKCNNC